jgi:hypothetical protein
VVQTPVNQSPDLSASSPVRRLRLLEHHLQEVGRPAEALALRNALDQLVGRDVTPRRRLP